jgi:uncharacterized protein YyaL (SSP411 family)
MPNRLAGENSPYLLQHSQNPVDWYPWGPGAARQEEDKPIFLSIGSACHWCRVMAHESFEDPATATRECRFINIKVDRERPDLDQVYMQAVVAISGSGGWPMSVFLTPEGNLSTAVLTPCTTIQHPSFTEILQTISRFGKKTGQTGRIEHKLSSIFTEPVSAIFAAEIPRCSSGLSAPGSKLRLKKTAAGKSAQFPQPWRSSSCCAGRWG